jgi:hypothetical protein
VKRVVLDLDDAMYARFKAYDKGDPKYIKFLILTAMEDYIGKREQRTDRAIRQRKGESR